VELLCPALFPIHLAKGNQHSRLELQDFFLSQYSTAIYLIEDCLNFRIRIIFRIEFFDAVVGQLASLGGEEVMTLAQSGNHIVESRNSHTAYFRQLLYVSTEIAGNFHSHRLVGAPGRKHLYLKSALTGLDMIFQRVNGVVRSTHGFHVITAHHAAGRIFGLFQFLVTFVVDFTCGLGVQNLVNAECRLQLQVRPVIQRIAESIRYGFRPFLKLFPIGGVLAGTETFVHTVGAHGTPLVVVASQPDFRQ